MKVLMIFVGLLATSFAAGPPTPTVINKIQTCLNAAGIITVPDFLIFVNVPLLPLLHVGLSVQINCLNISVLFNNALEVSYSEAPVGTVVNFIVQLSVTAAVNFDLAVGLDIWLLGIVRLQVGACVVSNINLSIDLTISGYYVLGTPTDCHIQTIDTCNCGRTGYAITKTAGGSYVDDVIEYGGTDISNNCFTKFQNKFCNTLGPIIG